MRPTAMSEMTHVSTAAGKGKVSLNTSFISSKRTLVHYAALVTLGSLLPFAARCANVRLEAKL